MKFARWLVLVGGMIGTFGAVRTACAAQPAEPARREDRDALLNRQLKLQTLAGIDLNGLALDLSAPPTGFVVRRDLGVVTTPAVNGQVLHKSGQPVWVPRATITPRGDYLLLFPHGKGQYYQGAEMLALRSTDRGRSWSKPAVAFDSSQSHHGFVPLLPRGTKRIYAFGTQAIPGLVGDRKEGRQENTPIGFRYSDDDGNTWAPVNLIKPTNDPEFRGMSCVRMCETEAGTWLIGSHDSVYSVPRDPKHPVATRQYILRSEDRGKTWEVRPGPRPHGWFVKEFDRMDEGTLLALPGGEAVMFIRTAEGHIWQTRSRDDGRTWSEPQPTPLVHPDAPPMVFALADGRTLIALIHNRYDPSSPHFKKADRNEVWATLSRDGGRSWSEPRFVFAGILEGGLMPIHSCSYLDLLADGPNLHLFLSQVGAQLLHLEFRESDLAGFPTKADLQAKIAAAPVARPNVLFVLTDDLGWADLGCYGNRFIETPTIDRLAASGMRFTEGYAAAPVCCPTRGSIVTGQYPARHGVHDVTPQFTRPWARVIPPPTNNRLSPNCVTIAQALASMGYISTSIGKHGRIGAPADHGFVPPPAAEAAALRLALAPRIAEFAARNPFKDCGAQTVQAIRFLAENRARPFFCYLNYNLPHEPSEARPELIAKYQAKARRQPTRIFPAYAAMVETIDESVGLVLAALGELGLADRTVVIFASDNGGMTRTDSDRPVSTDNAPLRDSKGTLYEGGIRVPWIVRWPGVVAAGATCREAVSTVDFYPTLVELAGGRPAPGHKLDGLSLVPLLRGGRALGREALYWHYPNYHMGTPASAVRAGRYKLIEHLEDRRVELFDVEQDIGEHQDLAAQEPAQVQRLRALLEAWRQSVAAPMPRSNPNYDPAKAATWGERISGKRKWANVP